MATTQERTQRPGADGAAARNDNLAAAIAGRCLRLPTVSVVGGQEGLRWHHLDGKAFLQRVAALAAELQARGVAPGDRVVLWVPNGWRTPALFAAIWQAGAIAVPFDREMNTDAAQAILRLVEARLVITGYGQRPDMGGRTRR